MPLFASSKENQLLKEFPAFVKETVGRVYPLIPATATALEMPATRAFSLPLVAYIAAFLPTAETAPYFKSNDSRISAVCDDHYSSTLEMLEKTADEAFKVNMTRKAQTSQGWFRRWECSRPSAAAASPGPCIAPDGAGSSAGAATPARPPASESSVSDDEGASDLITGGDCDDQPTSPTVDLEPLPPQGRA
jgi:hypothetical protein